MKHHTLNSPHGGVTAASAVTLLLLLCTPRAAAQEDQYGNFNVSTVVIVLIGIAVIILTGLLFIFLRHFSERCIGVSAFPGDTVFHGGERRQGVVRGVHPDVIKSLPTYLYSDVKKHKLGKGELECIVCLNEFEDQEMLRILPGCSHVFHPHCINPWLAANSTCPVCRVDVVDAKAKDQSKAARAALDQEQSHCSDQAMCRQDGDDHDDQGGQSRVEVEVRVHDEEKDQRVIGKFPRSHSTGHSMSRRMDDWDRYTLRLPYDIQKELEGLDSNQARWEKMVTNNTGSYHENMGNRWGWFSMTPPPLTTRSRSTQSPLNSRSTWIWSPKNLLLRSIKSPMNRSTPLELKDPGERSSDRLWQNSPV